MKIGLENCWTPRVPEVGRRSLGWEGRAKTFEDNLRLQGPRGASKMFKLSACLPSGTV